MDKSIYFLLSLFVLISPTESTCSISANEYLLPGLSCYMLNSCPGVPVGSTFNYAYSIGEASLGSSVKFYWVTSTSGACNFNCYETSPGVYPLCGAAAQQYISNSLSVLNSTSVLELWVYNPTVFNYMTVDGNSYYNFPSATPSRTPSISTSPRAGVIGGGDEISWIVIGAVVLVAGMFVFSVSIGALFFFYRKKQQAKEHPALLVQ